MLKKITIIISIVLAFHITKMYFFIFCMIAGEFAGIFALGFAILIGMLSQLGLFFSPFVVKKKLLVRIAVIGLMMPFIYSDVFPAVSKTIMLPFITSLYDWKFFYVDFISTICFAVLTGGIYLINIINLLRKDEKSQLNSYL